MTLGESFSKVLCQMVDSECEALKILDEIPSPVKMVAGNFIAKVREKLEAENHKVWQKLLELGTKLGRKAQVLDLHDFP